MCIQINTGQNEGRSLYIDSLTHAREWLGPATTMNIIKRASINPFPKQLYPVLLSFLTKIQMESKLRCAWVTGVNAMLAKFPSLTVIHRKFLSCPKPSKFSNNLLKILIFCGLVYIWHTMQNVYIYLSFS